jgi:O-antigen/teichoic acid export membrane protein
LSPPSVVNTAPGIGLRARFRHGITWNVVNAVFTQGSVFLSNIVVANLLGREIFGEYGMIQSTMLTLSGIAQVATGVTATKYVAEFRSTDKEKTGRILGLCSAVTFATGCVATLLLLAGAPWLASHTLRAPHLAQGITIAAGFVMFSVINGYQAGALAGLEGYRILARAGIIQGPLHLAVCGFGAWFWGLEGALGGLVASAAGRWLLYHRALRTAGREHGIFMTYAGLRTERRIILGFAVPAALSGLTSMPALWLANAFLVRQEAGFSQMGLYSAATTLRTLVLFLPALFNNVGMSLLNNEKGLGNEASYRKIFWFNLGATVGIAAVGAAIVSLAGPWLLRAFGREFPAGNPVLLILMLSTLPEIVAVSSAQIVQSREKLWLSLAFIALPRDISIVVLAFFLTPLYGAIGLAWAYTISWTLTMAIVILLVAFLGLNPRGRALRAS